jgi:hypothetical protein
MHRRFVLQRHEDVSGVSGTGVVAEGVLFSNGVVALQWTSEFPTSVVFHQRGMESVVAIHGHNGATAIEWAGDDDESIAQHYDRGYDHGYQDGMQHHTTRDQLAEAIGSYRGGEWRPYDIADHVLRVLRKDAVPVSPEQSRNRNMHESHPSPTDTTGGCRTTTLGPDD